MIAGTNAYCKLKDIKVSENIATITLLIFATQSTVPAKSFRLCVKDTDNGSLTYIDNNTYWIDHVNNYDFDANNVDTNKHKEILFTLDISRNSTSDIQGNRWIRNCYIYLIDASKDIESAPAWSSDLINLVSDDFETPTIKNISFDTTDISTFYLEDNEEELRGKIKTKFTLSYESEKDFNYNNDNFVAILNVRSIATDNILETKTIPNSTVGLYNEIETSKHYQLGAAFAVQLLITNKNGQIILDSRKIYKPTKKHSNSYIKTKDGIKRVLVYYVNTSVKSQHEGEWIKPTTEELQAIKVNYNNLFVKRPKQIIPTVYCYKKVRSSDATKILCIQIDDRIKEEPFYTNYHFEIYLNDVLRKYVTLTSDKTIEIENDDAYHKKYIYVRIKGYYYNDYGNKQSFDSFTIILPTQPICSDSFYCGEYIICNDLIDGYLYEGKFYRDENHTQEITDKTIGLYYNVLNDTVYKWNSEAEEFVII